MSTLGYFFFLLRRTHIQIEFTRVLVFVTAKRIRSDFTKLVSRPEFLSNYIQKVVEFDHKVRGELFIKSNESWDDALCAITKNPQALKAWIQTELAGMIILFVLIISLIIQFARPGWIRAQKLGTLRMTTWRIWIATNKQKLLISVFVL